LGQLDSIHCSIGAIEVGVGSYFPRPGECRVVTRPSRGLALQAIGVVVSFSPPTVTVNNFYESLGWLAANT
jgi:hypothetical protein